MGVDLIPSLKIWTIMIFEVKNDENANKKERKSQNMADMDIQWIITKIVYLYLEVLYIINMELESVQMICLSTTSEQTTEKRSKLK